LAWAVFVWRMPRQIHAVVQHSADFQAAIGRQASDQEVPRFPNTALGLGNVVAAIEKMVGQRALGEFRTGLAPRPPGVGGHVENGLNEQRLIAEASLFAEMLVAPSEDRL